MDELVIQLSALEQISSSQGLKLVTMGTNGSVHGIMVIIIGNGCDNSNSSSNPEWGCLLFT